MKKYVVKIVETLTYEIEVKAENEEMAEDKAWDSFEFKNNLHKDNDAEVDYIEEVEDEEDVKEAV
ncbi:DpnD/PcfM family protein [Neobacillus sp. C211]|uniref:DpnD/PcfM family protein n=1 Tax=unclassified Neobacillus TaxID=2675272 RepID=UPI00397E6F4F